MLVSEKTPILYMHGFRGCGNLDHPGKSKVISIGLFRNTDKDPLEKQFDPVGPISSRGRSVRSLCEICLLNDFFKPLKRQEKMYLKMSSAEVVCCK